MALPWGRASSSAAYSSTSFGDIEIDVLPVDQGPLASFRSLINLRAKRFPTAPDGTALAPPGSAYEINIKLKENTPGNNSRVVRASIDGQVHLTCEPIVIQSLTTLLVSMAAGDQRAACAAPSGWRGVRTICWLARGCDWCKAHTLHLPQLWREHDTSRCV